MYSNEYIYYDMEFNRNIVCFDVETTGLNKAQCRIIQIAVVKFNPNTHEILYQNSWYVKPTGVYDIDYSSTKVHGLTKEFIEEHGVSLASIIPDILEVMKDSDILTYNGTSFDIAILQKELDREGMYDVDLYEDRLFIDSFDIEKSFNSLKLVDVYKRYTGEELDDAHNAYADVMATIEVFNYQKKKYDVSESVNRTTTNTTTSPEGFITYDEDGELVFTGGKYKLRKVVDICKNDPSYIKWMWGKNGDSVVSIRTKRSIEAAYRKESL